MWHSLERLIKVQKFQLYSIYYRFVLRKMSVGLLVWWVFIEESVSMVGMVSLDALLLVCHGSDLWGSQQKRSIEQRWVRGAGRKREGRACILEKEKLEHRVWVRVRVLEIHLVQRPTHPIHGHYSYLSFDCQIQSDSIITIYNGKRKNNNDFFQIPKHLKNKK